MINHFHRWILFKKYCLFYDGCCFSFNFPNSNFNCNFVFLFRCILYKISNDLYFQKRSKWVRRKKKKIFIIWSARLFRIVPLIISCFSTISLVYGLTGLFDIYTFTFSKITIINQTFWVIFFGVVGLFAIGNGITSLIILLTGITDIKQVINLIFSKTYENKENNITFIRDEKREYLNLNLELKTQIEVTEDQII